MLGFSFVMLLLCISQKAFNSVLPKVTVAKQTEPSKIGDQRQLFVDDYLIEKMDGSVKMCLHHPIAKEVVINHNAPWEGSYCNNHSIFKDGDVYRMYYASVNYHVMQGKVVDNEHPFYLCYAESKDGIHWVKPNLGLYEFNGSKNNNIVLTEDTLVNVKPGASSAAIFKDDSPAATPDAKYKALLADYTEIGGSPQGALVLKSADAIHWLPMSSKPVVSGGSFDSQNVGFWDAWHKVYRAYWRYMAGEKQIRSIRTASSKDFVHWDNYADLRYVNSPEEHLYNSVIKTYYRAPSIIIGFPIRYIERTWSEEAMNALPEAEHRKLRCSSVERFGTALTEAMFMTSRDGVLFNRWEEAFLPPGIERPGTWNYGHQFIGWSIVETKSELDGAPNELSFYATESCWTDSSTLLRRYTLRLDGFVSISAPMSGGELLTKPVSFEGSKLSLNFSTGAAGEIKVELQDESGKPIPDFTLDDCDPVFGDTIDRTVYWKKGEDVSSLKGKAVRLRFVMKDADLYSFKFEE